MVLVKLNYDSCVLPVSGSMMTTKSHEQDDDIKIMLNRITLRPNQGARVTSSPLSVVFLQGGVMNRMMT